MKHKPYSKYKDSGVQWIGEIPEEWFVERFKIKIKTQKGRLLENLTEQNNGKSLPYLSMDYLRGNEEGVLYSDDVKGVKVNENDLLLLWDGSNAGEFVKSKKGYLSSTMVKLEYKKGNKDYIFYLCYAFEPLLRDLTIGMGIPHVNGDVLGNIRIPILEEKTQKKIVTFLDSKTSQLDQTIEKDKQLIELLKEKRIALINHVVTKGLDNNAKMKDSGIQWIGDISEDREIMPFRRICYVNQGLQFPEELRLEEPTDKAKIYLTIKYLHAEEDGIKEYIPSPPLSVICKKEDVLLARTGGTGEVITDQEGVFHNNFFRVNYNLKVLRDYLVYYLKMDSVKKFLLLKAGVTTIPDLNHDAFLSTPIIIPQKQTQLQIVQYLDKETSKIDKIIKKIEEKINLMEEYKKSLIHHVVTGKVDVREAVA